MRPLLSACLVLIALSCFAQSKRTPPVLIGTVKFQDTLQAYMTYVPKEVHDSCIRGTVVISFLVKTDGTIDSIVTRHKVHPLIDAQAHKMLFNTSGKWIPGTTDGVPVPMRKTLRFEFIVPHIEKIDRRYLPGNPALARWYILCYDAEDYYKIGVSLYRKGDYENAWKSFDRANRTDFIHLDAIDMLRKTGDIIGKPCEICEKLALLEEYSDREIKRIRDQYCTKAFKPIDNPATGANTVYQYLKNMPQPKTPVDQYIAQNMGYPASAKENCKQGTVLTKFVVKEDGSVDSVQVVYGVDSELDKEAIRLVGTMQHFWTPGTLEGRPVKVFYTLPIKFSSDNPACHNDEWYVTEGEKQYEADKMEDAFNSFRQAFVMNRSNYKAGYNYAAAALSLGKTDEACSTIRYLLDQGYIQAKELSDSYCK